jgi:hypothetical protein
MKKGRPGSIAGEVMCIVGTDSCGSEYRVLFSVHSSLRKLACCVWNASKQ